MVILGITSPISEDNAACLLIDGKLIAMVEEERLNGIKHAPRMAPDKAINFCLKKGNITLKDIDYIAVGFSHPNQVLIDNVKKKIIDYLHGKRSFRTFIGEIKYWVEHRVHFAKIKKYLKNAKVIYVRHHIAHAASSFYLSGFDKANIISLDGSGGQDAGLLGFGVDTKLTVLRYIDRQSSWGEMYERFTEKLGFKPHNDEGKVMALASYGKHYNKTFPFIDWNSTIPYIKRREFLKYLAQTKARNESDPITDEHKNLAAILQYSLEKAVLKMSKFLYKKTGFTNLCLAGGIALNCALNGKLLQSDWVERIFVQPAANDAGTALGAAVAVYVQKTGQRPDINFNHVYWGPEYGNEEIEECLKIAKVKYKKCDDICKEVAKLLANGKIVGWFQGKMEVGPRALGNRSILATPCDESIRDMINNRVKFREPWRPLAPSILAEYASEYLENAYPSPFMILAFKVKKAKIKQIAGVVHVDGTCRPQTVERSVNPKFWQLINEFRKLTGIPLVLNTSFNLRGKPIVCTPREAIATFFSCGMDYLAIGDFLVYKS